MAEDKDFQAAHEVGKIYNSFLDKKVLCDFFLDSAQQFISASQGYLFLSSADDKIWLEAATPSSKAPPPAFQEEAQTILNKGQPFMREKSLFLPLVVRNSAIGIACFLKEDVSSSFSEKEFSLASNLAFQAAGALKNILLYEENLRMERLAAMGQTVSIVLHEVKNIIQLARFAEEYLRQGFENHSEKSLLKGFHGIQRAIRDMDGFVYEMLSLTKNYKIKPIRFQFQTLLKELQENFQDKAGHLKVNLDFTAAEPFPEVEGEPQSLYRALVNLVKNAIEARDRQKPDSYVRVKVRSLDDHFYQVLVEDNGGGMSDEVKAKLFQAFFSTKGESGTGLGLLIIDRTIKGHHGEIAIESQLGQGTRFIIKLPKLLSKE